MKKINAIINSFAFLLLAVLMSACNKDGIETIVIEDGQPSVAQMLIGRWNPTGGEMANPSTGEVTEDINISDVPWLDFGENGIGSWGNGGSGTGGSAGESFDWNADEGSGPIIGGGSGYDGEGPSVTFGGERWYIFQLTERILIIYRFYGDYIIIYYYYRVGDYNEPEPEPTPEPDVALVSEIHVTTTYESGVNSYSSVYRFSYDDQNRIQNYTITNGSNIYEWTYSYRGVEEVYVSGDESYMGYIGREGINALYSLSATTANQVLVASPEYDSEGYMTMLGNNTMVYENGNMKYLYRGDSGYNYEYSDEENNANIDLNCIISDCSTYEYVYSHFSLFAPFRFYGKSSTNMISRENLGEYADMYYAYSYERNQQGQISKITRNSMSVWQEGEMFNTTVYEIFYE
ncbi:hypothetical protein H6B13_00110 [Bacteroides gallinaceum]|uniref:hypothetical protein n=1 Tax=Bacteroides gallinaceum TaxID=1462571 RepID=UPI00195BF900|nr:hypothetical protein [Bacteroides gallinaceum]MBM6718052.1 hypothetical protein [Bacteroides gallinaceum]